MSGFFGIWGAGQARDMQNLTGAPYLMLGNHVFCGKDAANDGSIVAHLQGHLRNGAELISQLRGEFSDFPVHPSPSQILLYSYRKWDESCCDHLKGAVCAAVLDTVQNKLVLSRDPMGDGRMFYARIHQSLAFANRAEYLLEAPGVRRVIDRAGMMELFALGPARTPGRTPFADIRELEPGCALICDSRGIRIHAYFRLEARPHEDSPEKTVDTVRGMLEEIMSPIRAMKPICMLSGGLDSTFLTALLAPEGGAESYSVDYAQNDLYFRDGTSFQGSQDAPWAQKAADFLHTNHHIVTLSQEALARALPDAARARFFPGMADVDSSLLLFSRALAQHGQYVLSGECSDEVFGGYPWFHREELIHRDLFPWSGSLPLRASILQSDVRGELCLEEYVRDRYADSIAKLPRLAGEAPLQARLRELQGLCFQYFMPNLQERALRMCEDAGVQVLTPFSDERLAQYVYNVPWEIKNMGGMEKGLLRAAAAGILPDELRLRKKSPYPKTYHPEFGRLTAEMCISALRESDSPLSPWLDMRMVESLASGDLSPRDAPWFGQLMTLPQMLGYLIQVDDFLRRTGAKIEI